MYKIQPKTQIPTFMRVYYHFRNFYAILLMIPKECTAKTHYCRSAHVAAINELSVPDLQGNDYSFRNFGNFKRKMKVICRGSSGTSFTLHK